MVGCTYNNREKDIMIYMDADQAADFFGAAPVPAHVVIETREELDARVAALIA